MTDLRRPLTTERLVLRPIEQSDADAITAILRDADVNRWLAVVPWPYPDGAAEEYIANSCSLEAEESTLNRAITLDETYIGCVGLTRTPMHRRAYLGYYIGQRWWGHGYVTEAARRLVQFAFDDLDCVRVDSSCYADNATSERVLRKLGFEQEGFRTKYYYRMGQWHDEKLFGLLR